MSEPPLNKNSKRCAILIKIPSSRAPGTTWRLFTQIVDPGRKCAPVRSRLVRASTEGSVAKREPRDANESPSWVTYRDSPPLSIWPIGKPALKGAGAAAPGVGAAAGAAGSAPEAEASGAGTAGSASETDGAAAAGLEAEGAAAGAACSLPGLTGSAAETDGSGAGTAGSAAETEASGAGTGLGSRV